MIDGIAKVFLTGQDKPPISEDKNVIKKIYDRCRWSVFTSITLGYALFYVCRLNFSVVKKPMMTAGVLDAQQIGLMGSVFFIAYGLGKCLNSFLADRMNIKTFLPFGLFMSSFILMSLGFIGKSFGFMFILVLWALNGWFQSYGAGPCIVSLNQWFSNRERGTYYGIWFSSHNLGGAFTYMATAVVVGSYGWQAGFWLPGAFCIVGSFFLYYFMYDRPQVYGLPPVADYKDDHVCTASQDKSIGDLQWEVVKRPAVWILGLSSCCCYIARYAVESWGIVFLTEAKGYSMVGASGMLSVMQVAGIFGVVTCGMVSDYFFNHRRNVPCLLYGILYTASVALFVYAPAAWAWADYVSMIVFGFTMGALVCYLGGLMAVDICPKKATGAAMGMIGLLSYGGASLQDYVSGYLINANKVIVNGKTVYDFSAAADFWVISAGLSCILAAVVWNAKASD